MAWHKDARQTSVKMFICFVPARLNFLSAIWLNGKFACLRTRRNTISLHWVWARHLYTLRKYLHLPKSSLTKKRGHEVAALQSRARKFQDRINLDVMLPNNVGSCCVRFQEAKSLTGFKHCATTCNRECKRTKHVISNNVVASLTSIFAFILLVILQNPSE